jgi:integral membrane sensor domain MASE1
MRGYETLRLGILALLTIVAQLALYQAYPDLRSADLYVTFLLLVSAVRGPLYGGTYGIIGGIAMDSFSPQYNVFHMFYYLLPVTAGTLIRSRMLLEYRQLGAAAVLALLLAKVFAQFAAGLALHYLHSGGVLLRLDNYVPIVLQAAIAYFFWPQLVRLIPEPAEVRTLA